MIDLTNEQQKTIEEGFALRIRENGKDYVVLRSDVYDRLLQAYDDSPWDADEMDRLREESVTLLDRLGSDA